MLLSPDWSARPTGFLNARLLGWGVLQAFGRRGGLSVHSADEGDVTARTRQDWPGGPAAFDAWSGAPAYALHHRVSSRVSGPCSDTRSWRTRASGISSASDGTSTYAAATEHERRRVRRAASTCQKRRARRRCLRRTPITDTGLSGRPTGSMNNEHGPVALGSSPSSSVAS